MGTRKSTAPDWRRTATDALKQGAFDQRMRESNLRDEIEATKQVVRSMLAAKQAAMLRELEADHEDAALSACVNLLRFGEIRHLDGDERYFYIRQCWVVTTEPSGEVLVTLWSQTRRGSKMQPSHPKRYPSREALRRALELEAYLKVRAAPQDYLPDADLLADLVDDAPSLPGGGCVTTSSGYDDEFPKGALLLLDLHGEPVRTLTLPEAWSMLVEQADVPTPEPVTPLESRYVPTSAHLDADADAARRVRERLHEERQRVCPACGETFTYTRVDQVACSGKCRVRLHRRAQR